ncbi:hypothetical protein [Streptomyces griseosporeus]|uniref:hypothetical protein n=1 Tax=Streptomyces griseosporeus TaxID=1910 RepID=UPI00167EF08C|nr:hypothetical protein [Streptomyces griseosporeus]GHF92128.1 hypothetical protein GCM10018783_73710 [Streptomyces griseosporeus]
MGKYKKKPVEIEAMPIGQLLNQAMTDWTALPDWVQQAYGEGKILLSNNHIVISTLEGSMVGNYTDYLIRGVQGEVYPCKPDIFADTYEEVVDG